MYNTRRGEEQSEWDTDGHDEVPTGEDRNNMLYATTLPNGSSAINNDEFDVTQDNDPLLGEGHHQGLNEEDLVKREDRARNLITALVMTGFVFTGLTIFSDAYDQWLYVRFEEQVMGVNLSKLNISATEDPCLKSNVTTNKDLDKAQSLAADFISLTTSICLIPAILTNILFGAYSDHIGRKIFFIVPISGMFIQFTVTWAICNWNLDLNYLYIGFVLNAIFGSNITLFMALYTYTADNTDEKKSRSLGMVLVGSFYSALKALSHTAVGYAIANLGYMWPMAASSLLTLTGLLGIIFFLRETLHRKPNMPCLPLSQGVKTIFSFHVLKSPDPKFKRKDFLILDLVFVLFTISTGPSIQTLYLFNEPFCWNSKKIGTMETIVGLLQGFCSIVVVKLLQSCVSDEVVCIICLVSGASYKLLFSLAQDTWMIYVALGVSLMQSTVLSVVRAIMSKMVPANKRGALLSSLAVIQVATVAASGAGFNTLYSFTVHFWRGFMYLIVSILIALGVLVMIAYIFMRKLRQQSPY